MTETAIVPYSGEIVDLTDGPAVAKTLHEIRELEWKLKLLKGELGEALIAKSAEYGTKTLRLGSYTATIAGGNELQWDVEILNELIDAGLPQERYADLVTEVIEYKVSAAVAKQLEGSNPAYAEIIGRARASFPKPQRVTVKA